MSCSVDHHTSGCEYFGRCWYVFPLSQQNLVRPTISLQPLETQRWNWAVVDQNAGQVRRCVWYTSIITHGSIIYSYAFSVRIGLVTSDEGGGTYFCPCLFVCLLARLLKNTCMDLDECCVSTDVGTWTNWLTFEPDQDQSPDAGAGLLSPISYKRNFTSGKSNWRRAARASRVFKMVLFAEPSEDLCRRYMRSTECPSSYKCEF